MTIRLARTLNLFILLFLISYSGYGQKCATTYRDSVAMALDPTFLDQRIERFRQIQKQRQVSKSLNNTIIHIPTVVHVIHTSADGSISDDPDIGNISVEQITSQMRVLNEDYRRKSGTPGFNDHPSGADLQIEFCLAKLDPDGNSTNGITRNYRDKVQYDPVADDREIKQIVQWPTDQYMNVYLVPHLKNDFLGYATFPEEPREWDGIVMANRFFGDRVGTAQFGFPYNRGRTLTHEVGHWLGLVHIWGDGGCNVDDGCDDTPQSDAGNFRCDTTHMSCGSVDMVRNYMDYSDDFCFNIFTICQKEIARATFDINMNFNRNEFLAASESGSINCGDGSNPADTVNEEIIPFKIGTNDYENASYVFFGLEAGKSYTLTIIDARGSKMAVLNRQTNAFGELRFDLSNQPAGIYFVNLESGSGEIRRIKVSGPVR